MITSSIRDMLGAEAVFGDLDTAHLDLLAGCSRNESFEAGTLLTREDEPANQFFVVRRGRLAIEIHAPGGPLLLDTAGPGDIVGWSWLVPPYRWSADVRAMGPAGVIVIDALCLRGKCEAEPPFGYQMMGRFARVLSDRLAATRLQLLDLYGGVNV